MKLTKKKSDRQFIESGKIEDKKVLARKIPKPKFPNLQLAYAWELVRTTPLSLTEIARLTTCFFDLHGYPEGIPLKTLKSFFEGKKILTPKEYFILLTCYGYNVVRPAPQCEEFWPHERPPFILKSGVPVKSHKKMTPASV